MRELLQELMVYIFSLSGFNTEAVTSFAKVAIRRRPEDGFIESIGDFHRVFHEFSAKIQNFALVLSLIFPLFFLTFLSIIFHQWISVLIFYEYLVTLLLTFLTYLTGCAKTGSGKTLCFLLPMLRHIMDQSPVQQNDGPIAVVIVYLDWAN